MANNHVEIHDPLSNHNLTSNTNCDPEPTSNMEDTVEFRILMAYAKRRRPKKDVESPAQDGPNAANGCQHVKGPSSPQTPAQTEKEEEKKKRKMSWKRLSKFISCVKPQIEDNKQPKPTSRTAAFSRSIDKDVSVSDDVNQEDKLEEVAGRLTEIADQIPFTPPEIETDSPDDDVAVEKVIGLLLRDAGDQLNEQELKDAITRELFWNYSFFENLITTLLRRMGLVTSDPDALGPQASPKTQIAVTCEVTSRLSAVNTLPMSRMLDHGARYLQDHYTSWAQQQGGYEEAFVSDNEDDDQ